MYKDNCALLAELLAKMSEEQFAEFLKAVQKRYSGNTQQKDK